MNRRTHRPGRRAFTLPELLVVITITLILMGILVTASGIITDTITSAKAQGDLVSQERMALAALKRDLEAAHFLDEDGKPNQGRGVSDQRTDQMQLTGGGPNQRITGYLPPRSGYFKAFSPAPQNIPFSAGDPNSWNFDEGGDTYGQSSRSGNHYLQFTVVLSGGAPENTVAADVPFGNPRGSAAYPIIGTAAEVAYFLVPDGTTPSGIGKFKLIRRQRLAARNADDAPAYRALLNSINPTTPAPALPNLDADVREVVAVAAGGGPTNFTMLNLSDLTLDANRLAAGAARPQPIGGATAVRLGEDVVLSNVISFEVKFTGSSGAAAGFTGGNTWPTPFANGNTDFPYDNLPFNGFYDTFTRQGNWSVPANLGSTTNTGGTLKPIRLTGAQVRLRVWNPSTKKTRQTTVAVKL